MEVRAVAKFVRVQPRKVRQVAREVRGKSAVGMAQKLQFHPSKGAFVLRKVLVSAISNAEANHGLRSEGLNIKEIRVDEGPRLKRIQPRAMGRANRIVKRMSHITVVVEDGEEMVAVKPHGTKAKARPSLAKAGKKKAKKSDEKPSEVVEAATEEAPVVEGAQVEEAPVEATEEANEPIEEAPVEEQADSEESGEDKS